MKTENKERLFLAVEVFLAGFAVAFTALNRRKLSRLEKKLILSKETAIPF